MKYCVERSTVNYLSYNCLEAEMIGSNYSCLKCDDNYTLVYNNKTKLKDCYIRKDSLSFCLEANYDNDKYTCTKCVDNTTLKDNVCSCNTTFFSIKNYFCREAIFA